MIQKGQQPGLHPGRSSEQATWGRTIGHVSLEYAPAPDQLIYGRLSTGYRAGGFNTFSPGAPTDPIKEETLVNYEVGMKGLYLARIAHRFTLSEGIVAVREGVRK